MRWFAATANHLHNLSGNYHGPGPGACTRHGANARSARYNHDHNQQFSNNTVNLFWSMIA
jgi:hypothetical protein